jgi:nuclear pore complex protein Nup155
MQYILLFSAQPSVSGLHDSDYPSLADPKIGLESVSEVSAVRKHPLPHDIVEQFGRILSL